MRGGQEVVCGTPREICTAYTYLYVYVTHTHIWLS